MYIDTDIVIVIDRYVIMYACMYAYIHVCISFCIDLCLHLLAHMHILKHLNAPTEAVMDLGLQSRQSNRGSTKLTSSYGGVVGKLIRR